jgi:hypothetical protein
MSAEFEVVGTVPSAAHPEEKSLGMRVRVCQDKGLIAFGGYQFTIDQAKHLRQLLGDALGVAECIRDENVAFGALLDQLSSTVVHRGPACIDGAAEPKIGFYGATPIGHDIEPSEKTYVANERLKDRVMTPEDVAFLAAHDQLEKLSVAEYDPQGGIVVPDDIAAKLEAAHKAVFEPKPDLHSSLLPYAVGVIHCWDNYCVTETEIKAMRDGTLKPEEVGPPGSYHAEQADPQPEPKQETWRDRPSQL